MKKNLIALLFGCAAIFGGVVCGILNSPAPIMASAEEVGEPEPEMGSVVIVAPQHGSIVADVSEAEVGTVVALTVKADAFYKISSVTANEIGLSIADDGLYHFALKAGKNTVSASFILDETGVNEFVSLFEKIKSGKWEEIFSLDNVLLIINYFINSGIGVALVSLTLKYKKGKTIEREEIVQAITSSVPEQAEKIIQDLVNEKLLPVLTPIIAKEDDMMEAMKTFIQAFLYSLDDTMDAKEKIISLLSNIKLTDSSTVDEVKKILDEYTAQMEARYQANLKLLQDIKESSKSATINGSATIEEKEEVEPIIEEHKDDGTQI